MRSGRARVRLSAVFLDRDGVINEKAPDGLYVTSWADFRLLPRALAGLRRLNELDVPVVVVTNQRGIARGAMTIAALDDIHWRLRAEVTASGGRLDAIYHCPHEGPCACRKPEPGMLEQAARELGFELADSVMIGDQDTDMMAATRVGALRVGVGDAISDADHRAPDLFAAAELLIGRGGGQVNRSR